ncbi:MAG TPA: tetratricopeptide repeat protein, partial [Steroidobacteraceae bacterium]|nr:tetratricopeptide repeat protein [Steroidobacteraceae bacterium]
MQGRRFHWVAAFLAAWVAAQAVAAVTDADRQQSYKQFRTLFDAKRYTEALPVAEKIVSMTEEQYGAADRALVNPLTNLGTVHYRLKDYPAAEKDYQRSVEILEATAGSTERQLLRPLHGLGASHFAEGEFVDASVALKRAIDLSRNLDGLFNVEQLQILEPLISSYIELDLKADAEKEQQYALRV